MTASRFADAGLEADRFVDVRDGGKACFDHDTRYSDPRDAPGTNYGVYADADGRLVILDVDDYRADDSDRVQDGLKALFDLPPTLEASSPHGGTHKFYIVEGGDDNPVADLLDTELGTPNPTPSWGEVQVANKYVVGAGSQLDGCSKDWCDDCATADGGRYEVRSDQSIATVDAETLVHVLAADADVAPDSGPPSTAESDETPTLDPERTKSQTGTAGGSAGFDEWLDEDLASDALEEIEPDVRYPVWRNIGFALAELFPSGTAKRLFKSWSRGGSKWDGDAPDQADRIIADAESGDVSPATLVYHAKQGGWEPPAGAPSTEDLLAEHGDSDEPLPFWLLRQAAVEFGVCDPADLVEHETEDGDTYLGFDAPTYNAVLRALKDRGIEHGRELIDTETRSEYYEVDLAEFVDDGSPWTDPDTMLRACLRARAAGGVSEFAAPPTLALLPLQRDVLNLPPNRDMNPGTKALLEDLFHDLSEDELGDLLDGE
jgi:hypothetical protein